MKLPHIVMDTNVLITALRSRRGASFLLLSLIGTGHFDISVSVSLVLEYEDAAKRLVGEIGLAPCDIDDVLDYLCAVSRHQQIFYLWRPFLADPGDDMLLELAVAAGAEWIVSHNKKHFHGIEAFGVRAATPAEFLIEIGVLS